MELVEAFQAAVGAPVDAAAALVAAREAAHAAWPDFAIADARFGAHLGALVQGEASPLEALGRLRAAEVYLTLACADGVRAALDAFDRAYLAAMRVPLERMGLAKSAVDEAIQIVRTELLAPRADGGPSRILNFAGRGALHGWLRAVAGRAGLRLVAHPERNDAFDDGVHAPIAGDLELAYMKKLYGEAFQRAFATALGELAERDRLLLKQRYRHHLTVEELGVLHGVNAGTISRWVAAARERLAGATRAAMMGSLEVGKADVSSILRLIHSQLDLSLRALET